jgi:hypothetical protein
MRAWAQRPFKVQDLTGAEMGFEVVPWDGKKAKAIYDSKGRLVTVLAGQPQDQTYVEATKEGHRVLMKQGEAYREIDEGRSKGGNRRGDYDLLGCGMTHGNGTTKPINLSVKEKLRPVLEELLSDKSLQRLAGNGSGTLRAWAPAFHRAVEEGVKKVTEANGELRKPFPGSVYPACSFNFGPNAWCYIHRDSLNVTNGYCAIHALGDYDPTTGGHLVLWDLKKAVEFPPGSTVLIMSSLLFHSSLAVGPGEERSVMTQYCPEGLLRYADSGLKTDKELCAGMEEEVKKEFLKGVRKGRKDRGLNNVPTECL